MNQLQQPRSLPVHSKSCCLLYTFLQVAFSFFFFFFTFSQFTAGFGKVIWVQQDGIFLLTLLYMYLFVLHERYLSLVHVSDPPQCDRHPKMTDDLAATLMLIILLQFIVNSCWFWKMSLPSFFGLMYCLGTQPITAFHSGSHYITVW